MTMMMMMISGDTFAQTMPTHSPRHTLLATLIRTIKHSKLSIDRYDCATFCHGIPPLSQASWIVCWFPLYNTFTSDLLCTSSPFHFFLFYSSPLHLYSSPPLSLPHSTLTLYEDQKKKIICQDEKHRERCTEVYNDYLVHIIYIHCSHVFNLRKHKILLSFVQNKSEDLLLQKLSYSVIIYIVDNYTKQTDVPLE